MGVVQPDARGRDHGRCAQPRWRRGRAGAGPHADVDGSSRLTPRPHNSGSRANPSRAITSSYRFLAVETAAHESRSLARHRQRMLSWLRSRWSAIGDALPPRRRQSVRASTSQRDSTCCRSPVSFASCVALTAFGSMSRCTILALNVGEYGLVTFHVAFSAPQRVSTEKRQLS
jgi:hypothetical protein